MSSRRAFPGVVLLVVLALLAGCSDATNDGYVTVTVGRLTVDRPVGWDTEFAVESPWNKGFRDAPDAPEQLSLAGDFGSYATAAQGMGTLIGKAQVGLAGFTVTESREVTVEGATTAQLTRYTITGDDSAELHGLWIVAAHWPYPQSVAVSILVSEPDPALERELLESMELRPVTE
ncbi:hypothetical protein [Microlunatus speluncae]|uniref:hypothetical protein n=1 Tax=Microlunatus speluncae TaxID=2594267 RepID=UPI001375AB3F|nr:hypothetical protein [Microlunatus speluncae]